VADPSKKTKERKYLITHKRGALANSGSARTLCPMAQSMTGMQQGTKIRLWF